MDIHECCRTGNLVEFRRLLVLNIDVNQPDDSGYMPVHIASDARSVNHTEIVRLLIEHGADINVKNRVGHTPLYYAVKYKNINLIRELIEHGANVTERDDFGSTYLHIASSFANLETVQILIEYCDPFIKNNFGCTALDVANSKEIKEFLANYERPFDLKEPEVM
jgi:ankyrin repeat protein